MAFISLRGFEAVRESGPAPIRAGGTRMAVARCVFQTKLPVAQRVMRHFANYPIDAGHSGTRVPKDARNSCPFWTVLWCPETGFATFAGAFAAGANPGQPDIDTA
jgi:hypothetical protein